MLLFHGPLTFSYTIIFFELSIFAANLEKKIDGISIEGFLLPELI